MRASVRAAIAAAAHRTLMVLFPKKIAYTELFMRQMMALIGDQPTVIKLGIDIGRSAADTMLKVRDFDGVAEFNDGSETDGTNKLKKGLNNSLDLEPLASKLVGSDNSTTEWRVDPITKFEKAIGGYWSFVKPFVLDPKELFIPPKPPQDTEVNFVKALNEVREKGGDPNPVKLGDRHISKTTRTGANDIISPDVGSETFEGIYWAYDATALLCAPPRLYNMIATSIATEEHKISEVAPFARYLALINLALADAAIAAWTAKFHYKYSRPVTYIRYKDPDQTILDTLDRDWTPLGAPVSNGTPQGANMTPPFPAYPSGHAVLGGALFECLRRLVPIQVDPYEKFEFVSDEFNGLNRGPTGEARDFLQQSFVDYKDAEVRNACSRIYLGIHWKFDAVEGIIQGNKVAKYIVENVLGRV